VTSTTTATSSAPAGARTSAPAVSRFAAPAWRVWGALSVVYVVWGSTYLGIRVVVDTMPPLLSAGVRFTLAGAVMLGVLAARRGREAIRPTRAQLLGCLAIGAALVGANGIVSLTEQEVPSALAALLFASIPLWVVLLRRLARERVPAGTLAAVLVGFAGVAVLLRPGEQSADASALLLVVTLLGALCWASGLFLSPRLTLPGDAMTAAGWQMVLGGILLLGAGLVAGEAGDVRPQTFSVDSLVAFGYLVVVGSWIGFTAFAWVVRNAPVSKVATYAYVNPAVAIVLGWLILDETITPVTLVGAAIIVASVAIVVRSESR
jgi:drug/metabolite transporter (DMT)-like permease